MSMNSSRELARSVLVLILGDMACDLQYLFPS